MSVASLGYLALVWLVFVMVIRKRGFVRVKGYMIGGNLAKSIHAKKTAYVRSIYIISDRITMPEE